jgi:hypothetical protein
VDQGPWSGIPPVAEDKGAAIHRQDPVELGEDLGPLLVFQLIEPLAEVGFPRAIEIIGRIGDDQVKALIWEFGEEQPGIGLKEAD